MAKDVRFSTVDGLKILLFMRIFLFHLGFTFCSPVWGGVQSFLVISAFLLSYKWIGKNREEVKPYHLFKRRVLRLYPAYLAVIIPISVFFVLINHKVPDDFFYYFFSAQSFYWVFTDYSSDLITFTAHTWFITLSVYLFLLWVILLRYVPRKMLKGVCVVTIIIAFLYRTLCVLLTDSFYMSYIVPMGQMDAFAIGCLLAINLNEDKDMLHNKRRCCWNIGIGIAGIFAFIAYLAAKKNVSLWSAYIVGDFAGDPLTVNIFFFISLMGAGLIRYCLSNVSHPILGSDLLVKLGTWIYVLYLFHWPIIQITKSFVDSKFLVGPISLILVITCAYLWDKYIEPHTKKLLYR